MGEYTPAPDPNPPAVPIGRVVYIDALRGAAALAVVVFHLGTSTGVRPFYDRWPGWLARGTVWAGHAGVVVFFVISGFVMAHATAGTGRGAGTVTRTFLRRLVRLAPPYWAAIAVAVAAAAAVTAVTGTRPQVPTALQFLAHLAYLQRELGYEHIDGVYWTLCLEVRFYLIFLAAFALTGGPRRTAAALLGLAVLGLGGPAGVYGPAHLPGTGGLAAATVPGMGYCFALGCVCYYTRLSAGFLAAGRGYLAAVVVVGLAQADPRCVTAGATGLAVMGLDRAAWLRRAVEARWLLALGAVSYSLYLFHGPVGLTVCAAGGRLLPATPPAAAATLAVGLAAAVAAAFLAYRGIERPAVWLSRRLKPAGRTAG